MRDLVIDIVLYVTIVTTWTSALFYVGYLVS